MHVNHSLLFVSLQRVSFVLLPLPLCPFIIFSQLIRKRRRTGQNSRTCIIQPFLIISLNPPLSTTLPLFPSIPSMSSKCSHCPWMLTGIPDTVIVTPLPLGSFLPWGRLGHLPGTGEHLNSFNTGSRGSPVCSAQGRTLALGRTSDFTQNAAEPW